ncbi:MAG TPA: hypothetical protein VFB71_12650 [Ramlibacter sp.]|nr:hypothetical protein [Ramlibacter sp.]
MPARSWLLFDVPIQLIGQTTFRWGVRNKESGDLLGEVAWFGRWRRYCFHPRERTVFEQDCLREIATFCEERTKEHRAAQA